MPVPKFAFEVACAPGFASYMDDDVPWDARSIVRKARPNSIALEKGNLGTRMRANKLLSAGVLSEAARVGFLVTAFCRWN